MTARTRRSQVKALAMPASIRGPLTPVSQGPSEDRVLDAEAPLLIAPVSRRTRSNLKRKLLDELPHNLGSLPSPSTPTPVVSQPSKRATRKRKTPGKNAVDADTATPNSVVSPSPASVSTDETLVSRKRRAQKSNNSPSTKIENALPNTARELVIKVAEGQKEAVKVRKVKNVNYGLTPGRTPFPHWVAPTHEQCYEVARILSDVHGEVVPPKVIPPPSTTVTGCGEVPSVLDALIRTRLSAATTGANSARAFKGLVSAFGILEEGIGKGSVNWDKVRQADVKEIELAIKSGGLAEMKSKDIKAILEMVYEEGLARRDALMVAQQSEEPDEAPIGADKLNDAQRQRDIDRANANILSLDHLHLLKSEEAFNELVKYPGIGPKTASCVLLFCLQRPSFAVDTHVFRLCRWLGWVPPEKPSRETCFSHCEVRIPDELKYPLHQLFIKHGKGCPRCRASTSEAAKGWEDGCPIDHLVNRTGSRKGPKPPKTTKPKHEECDGLSDASEYMFDAECDSDFE